MSYNVNWGAPRGHKLDDAARVIAGSGADVVGVQQLRRFAGNAKKGPYDCGDQPARLAAMLSELTGHRWSWAWGKNSGGRAVTALCRGKVSRPSEEGVAVFSRYPIVSTTSYGLPYERALAKARIRVPGGDVVSVYTVHLDSFSSGKRAVQARDVLRIVRKSPGITFLTGDMNSQADTAPIRMLRTVLRDAWAEKGKGAGATRRSRIDYVFYRGDVRVDSVEVVQSNASDHRPVVATFSLAGRT